MLAFSLYISVTQTQAVTLASHILSRLWCYSSTSMIGTWSPLYCEEISLDFIWYQKFLAFQLLSYKPPEWLAASHSYGNLPHVRSCTCRVLILHYCQALRFPLSRTPQQLPLATLPQSPLQGRDCPDCCWLSWEQPYRLAPVKLLPGLPHPTLCRRSAKDSLVSSSPFWSSKGGKPKWIALKCTKSCLSWSYWWGRGKGRRRKMFSCK